MTAGAETAENVGQTGAVREEVRKEVSEDESGTSEDESEGETEQESDFDAQEEDVVARIQAATGDDACAAAVRAGARAQNFRDAAQALLQIKMLRMTMDDYDTQFLPSDVVVAIGLTHFAPSTAKGRAPSPDRSAKARKPSHGIF